ncbi:isopentenyl-diphosphate Delta-isomerase [Aliiroseovarius crassostreae]|uniref:Isopentenyl-diphosphate Delta-isomerase n=1 Tax=Aliiroseovarius crassostreae TaxID=154981 RepID=A0A9Q9H7Y4_9RHOB|nr:isopentenyl-diphosphate Delta-isomerase [Aliiroseovarius crassostreae]UWP95229.1 isopentenyl-diphosphate Delta-isomerase [Aliiroseovarius crassostreae]
MNTKIPTWVDGTLIPVDKLEAHVKAMRHKAVSVFILHKGKVLLQQRAAGKYHTPNLWANSCCTHPHWGEDPRDCAIRRLREELGITGLDPVWVEQLEYRADVGGGLIEHEVVDLFVIRCDTLPKIDLNPEEVQATRWADPAELDADIARTPEVFTPWLRIYLRDHRASVFGA